MAVDGVGGPLSVGAAEVALGPGEPPPKAFALDAPAAPSSTVVDVKQVDREIKAEIKYQPESQQAYKELKSDPTFQRLPLTAKKAILDVVKDNPDADSIRDLTISLKLIERIVSQVLRTELKYSYVAASGSAGETSAYGTVSERAQRETILREARLRAIRAEAGRIVTDSD